MSPAIVDVSEVLDRQRLAGFNVRILLVTLLVTTTYGFEFSPTILIGPDLRWEWNETGADYSLRLAGLLAIAFFLAPLLGYLADRFGRRRVIVAVALLFGLVALAAAVAMNFVTPTQQQIDAPLRLTAVALGSVIPILVALVTELAPSRARATMVIIVLAGIGVGGGLRLLVLHFMQPYGASFIAHFIMWFGGLAPLVAALVLLFALPESPKFLALHPTYRNELIALLRKIAPTLNISPETRFIIGGGDSVVRASPRALFAGPLHALTPLYCILIFITLIVLNFVIEQMLLILMASGLSPDRSLTALMFLQFSGALGGLLVARLIDKFGVWPVPVALACAIPIMIGIDADGFAPAAFLAGTWFCLLGALFGSIATGANIYPTSIRALATSLCFAVARAGSGLYWLLDDFDLRSKLGLWRMFAPAAILLGVGVVLALLIASRYRALRKKLQFSG